MPVHFPSNQPPQQNGGGGGGEGSVWENLRAMLGGNSFSEDQQMRLAPPQTQQSHQAPQQYAGNYQQQPYQQQYQQPYQATPQQHHFAAPAAPKSGLSGFLRPFSGKHGNEVLKLGSTAEEAAVAQPNAKDWNTFVQGWLEDDNDPVSVEQFNGRVNFATNNALLENAERQEHGPATIGGPGQPVPQGQRSRKSAIRGVSAAPKGRAKSAFRRPGAVSAKPVALAPEEDEEMPEEKGIIKKKKKSKRDKKNPFIMPSLHTFAFEHLVHNIVWRVGRNFGFQAFNINPATRNRGNTAEWTPASIFVASDHLVQKLVRNYFIRREKGEDERQEERFAKAVFELHTTIFYSFEEHWTHMHGLSIRPQVMQDVLDRSRFCDETVVCGMLTELALYYLIYTESSSMRHTPELLWFIYWCCNHSYVMQDLWSRDPPENFPNIREVRIGLRNKHQALIRELQHTLGIYPDRIRPEDCGRLGPIMSRLKGSDVPEDQRIIIADLIAFGDGNFYYERVVTPIFYVISYEVDHLSNLGVDVAFRLGYDDINESMAHTGIVRLALRDLRVRGEQILRGEVNDSYGTITRLGYKRGTAETHFDPQVAADWWRTNVFVKTYRERRTWAAVFRAYYRVIAAHLVLYHGMQAQAFAGWNYRLISSCLITHAFCTAFERFCNWYMTRHPPEPLQTALSKVFDKKGQFRITRRGAQALAQARAEGFGENKAIGADKSRLQPVRVVELEGSPYLGIFGFVEWVMLAFFMCGWYVLQYYDGPFRNFCHDYWPLFSWCYIGAYVGHFILTTRDGYVISLTHALNLGPLAKASSSRPDPINWIYGTMHMKWKLFRLNALFWIIAFAMKVPFDYYIICLPSVEPLKLTFKVNWLECPRNHPRYWGVIPCVGGDWVLAFVRLAPFVIVILLDTSLFYQVTTTLFGLFRGLFKLDLGVLTAWEEVVKEFYKAPYRWWFRCMSESGNRNQLTLLKMMLFDNAADPETGAIVSDGRMFKKAVLTPEEIMGKQKKVVNTQQALDQAGANDDDSAAAAGGQGPRGVPGKGGQGGAGKGADGKPLSQGWKMALQNFGMGGNAGAGGNAGGGGKIVAPKGGPMLPTSTNMKQMQQQLNKMQRLPQKLPMTTITERMIATTEKKDNQMAAEGKPTLASVAEKLLGNKAAAQAAQQLKTMTPEEKRKEIVARIQAAQMQRKAPGAAVPDDGPSGAGLPSGDMMAGGGGGLSAGVMVNASKDAPPMQPGGRWGRALGAFRQRRSSAGDAPDGEGSGDKAETRRDTLTQVAGEDVPLAKPDAEEVLRPFSGAAASRKALVPRGSAGEDGVKADAALEDADVDDDKDKPASAGSAATVATLERAGVLGPGFTAAGSSSMPRVGTPTLMGARVSAGGAPPEAVGLPPSMAGLQPSASMLRGAPATGNARMSTNGIASTPAAMAVASADAPPRYSWTGAPSDAEAMGRQLSVNRAAAETAAAARTTGSTVASPTTGYRPTRLGSGPKEAAGSGMSVTGRLSDMGELLGPAGRAALASGGDDTKLQVVNEDDDDLDGGYQGYQRVFSEGQESMDGGAAGGSGAGSRIASVAPSPVPMRLPSPLLASGGAAAPLRNSSGASGSGVGAPAAAKADGVVRAVSLSQSDHADLNDFLNEVEAAESAPPRTAGSNGSGGARLSATGGSNGSGGARLSATGGRLSATGTRLSGAGAGSSGSNKPGPVAEGLEPVAAADVAERLTSSLATAAGEWSKLLHSGMGPLVTIAGKWVQPKPVIEEVEEEEEETTSGSSDAQPAEGEAMEEESEEGSEEESEEEEGEEEGAADEVAFSGAAARGGGGGGGAADTPAAYAVVLEGLQLDNLAVVEVLRAAFEVSCARCAERGTLIVASSAVAGGSGGGGGSSSSSQASASALCPKCNSQWGLVMRPHYVHATANSLAVIKPQGCSPLDLLPSLMAGQCGCCNAVMTLRDVQVGEPFSRGCSSCHKELQLSIAAVSFIPRGPPAGGAGGGGRRRGGAAGSSSRRRGGGGGGGSSNARGAVLQLGQPLPGLGTCKHYRHSYRWLRFPCCGARYACDLCHEEGAPDGHPAVWAQRMVCGFCSLEQPLGLACRNCGRQLASTASNPSGRRTRFWEGGQGCRDVRRLNRNDPHKYKGKNKTQSAKSSRVGPKPWSGAGGGGS